MRLGRVSTKNDSVKDSNGDAREDRKPQCHSNLGLSDLLCSDIAERLPAVNSTSQTVQATVETCSYQTGPTLKSSQLQE